MLAVGPLWTGVQIAEFTATSPTVSFLEAKRPEREADNFPYASKDINKAWGFTSPICVQSVTNYVIRILLYIFVCHHYNLACIQKSVLNIQATMTKIILVH
jgi:hypothetical protein